MAKTGSAEVWVCTWCGHQKGGSFRGCSAPDGDGHLYQRFFVEVVSGKAYYGAHSTKYVLLKDGVPFLQGSLPELSKSKYFPTSLKESK